MQFSVGWRLRRDGAAVLFLALLTLLFFYPLWGRGAWLPAGGGDAVSFIYPMYRFIASSLSSGEIPLWNPYQYAGAPLIADNQAGIFYPFNLVLFFVNPDFSYRSIEMLVAWHTFWAGLGCYICARVWWMGPGIGRISALTAAVAFMFSDLFITHLGNPNLNAVAAWLPWALAAYHLASRKAISQRQRLWWTLLCGLTIGVSTLAGHGQMTFFIAMTIGVYGIWRAVAERNMWALPLVAIVGLIGVSLSALTILPAYDLNELTRRGAFTYEQSVNYSLPFRGLLGLFAPGFFGRGPANFWGDWQRVEVGYIGVVTLLLALGGLRHAKKQTVFLASATVFFFLLALGEHTPIHRLIFEPLALPFQVPARFILIANWATALLAARGVEQLLQREWAKPPLWGALGAILLILVWLLVWRADFPHRFGQINQAIVNFVVVATLAWGLIWARGRHWLPPNRLAQFLLVLVAAELFLNGQYVEIEWNRPISGFERNLAAQFVHEHAQFTRIDEATGAWQPSAAQLHQVYSAGGVFNPLQLATHAAVMGSVGFRGSPVYSLLGIEYIISGKDEPPGDTALMSLAFADDDLVNVWRNNQVLPRVQVLYDSIVVADHGAAFNTLHSGIDFTKTLILEQGEPQSGSGNGSAEIITYGLNNLTIRATTDQPGYLLLTDMHYPHWQALINGESAEILRANYAFRAVKLDAGEHNIELSFNPPAWVWGWRISMLAWVLTLSGLTVLWLSGRTKHAN